MLEKTVLLPRAVYLRLATSSMLTLTIAGAASADVFTNVPEVTVDGYQLVYTLPIQNRASYNAVEAVPYTVDNSASISSPFDRIAFYLELDSGSGVEYVYTSMDAYTSKISQIGIPSDGTGANFQRQVANMNIVSNSDNVTTGNDIDTGNIEFWPRNYGTENAAQVPGASSSIFDFGDVQHGSGNYGSLQVHNYGAGETVFAYNQWGGQQRRNDGDLGIGNAPTGNPDWTFAHNAASYTLKNLQVLVRPSGLSVDSSLERAIFQRNSQNEADLPLTGLVVDGASSIEARATPRVGSPGTATDWQVIDASPMAGSYSGSLTLEGGWYDIEVRSLSGATVIDQIRVERVGVGEVFVVAGQSNSANHGSPTLAAKDDRVSSFDLSGWRHADDPQPIATGSGGSPWPALGDALAQELNVPIGFASVGWGGTTVAQWLPGGNGPALQPLYNRLRDALESLGPGGARAVLWHQGESDNVSNTSTSDYRQRLETIVAQSRIDAGYEIPWGIAQVSYLPNLSPPADIDILAAQLQVVANDPLNFPGAATDDLINDADMTWRWDNVHFNEAGLREHASRWYATLLSTFDFVQLVGDFDADDDVDAVDLATLSIHFGLAGGTQLTEGDADGDQDTDGADFFAWQRNFGKSAGNAASDVPLGDAVPEPSSQILLLNVSLMATGRRRLTRSQEL